MNTSSQKTESLLEQTNPEVTQRTGSRPRQHLKLNELMRAYFTQSNNNSENNGTEADEKEGDISPI
jgi:hypothetical protein